MPNASDATTRFSNRVADYIRYRPGYPDELITALQEEAGLKSSSAVADIGSGTGISAEPFLRLGCVVYGVEPNREMREASENHLKEWPHFHSVNGTAEATTLEAGSIDVVTAGQAFHWFDVARTRIEFRRILQPRGIVALFWNSRRVESTQFLKGYEQLLHEFATDYRQVDHRNIELQVLADFFGGSHFQTRAFPNSQTFDFEGLRGRLLSSSYTPAAGHPDHAPMLKALERLFETHAINDRVHFDYDTELFFGPLV